MPHYVCGWKSAPPISGARTERLLRAKRERLDRLRLQLEERGPLRVLERGYAIATDATGTILRDATQVALGDTVAVHLHQGRLTTEVKKRNVRRATTTDYLRLHYGCVSLFLPCHNLTLSMRSSAI